MIASILHDMEWVLPLRHDALTPVFKVFTTLGYTEFFLAALPVLYWCWNREAGNRIAILTLLAGMLTLFLKDWFQDPRPPAALAVDGMRPDSYGLPSGHTLMAIVFWGSLAFESAKRWVRWLAVIMITGITTSRLYLAVHDVEDVLAGIIVGGSLLALLILKRLRFPRCCRDLRWWWCRLLPPFLLMLFYPDDGINDGKFVMIVTFYAAWVIGNRLSERSFAFTAYPGWKRIAAGVGGMLLLVFCAMLLRMVLTNLPFPGHLAEATAGLVIGAAVTMGIPQVLLKTKLLQRSKS